MNNPRKFSLIGALLIAMFTTNNVHAGTNSATATGPTKQTLTVSPGKLISDNQVLTVTGKGYKMNVGIYVAFCVIPAKGKKPDHCSGGINLDGTSKGSVWISSNPPWYIPSSLLTAFSKGGTFKVQVTAAQHIDDQTDCKVVKCGVITRADHTNSNYRKADVLIPLKFK